MNARTLALVVLVTTASAVPAAAQLRVIPYSTAFSAPVAFVQDPSDPTVQLIVEQRGMIWALKNGVKQPTPFLDLRTETTWALELGMLSLALAPDYQATGRLYVIFSNRPDGHTVVARFRRSSGNPLVADPASRFDLRWASEGGQRFITQPSPNHKGGQLAFGADGYLYIGLGDGDGDMAGDPVHRAQNPKTLLGKMLRIDVSVPDADPNGYRVPADNPFVDAQPIAALPEIWAFGLRNPWRWAFDQMALGGTGALILADVGQTSWEEIDYEPRGAGGRNYGWRNREGAHPFVGSLPPAYLPLTDPIHEYSQSGGASITGGQVYRGSALGFTYRGRYFYADHISRRLWSIGLAVKETGEATRTNEIEHTADLGADTLGNVSAFGIDHRGELFVVSHSLGAILRVLLDTQPAPTAAGVAPGTSPLAGGVRLTITGTNFISGATVSIGGLTGIDPVVTSATTLQVTAPAHGAGTVNIVVTNPDGQQATLSGALVYAQADLSIAKSATPNPVPAGTLLTYALSVGNAGPTDAKALTLTDALPAGTTFASLVAPAGWSCTSPALGSAGTLNCSTASLLPGGSAAFTLVVRVDAAVPAGTVITNTATVSAATPDPTALNNTASATTTVSAVADLAVTKIDSPDPVFRGQVETYTITVANNGPSVATAVTLSDLLPAETRFESLTAPAGWTCTAPAVGGAGAITCSRPAVAPGTAVFALRVRIDPGITAGTLTNTATTAGSSIDPVSANNTATVTTAMTVLSYHFAEGSGGFFQTYLLIGNPNLVEAPIVVHTLGEGGTTTSQTNTVPPESRRTIPLQPSPASFASRVLSPAGLPLSIERSMFFNAFAGGHTQEATQPSLTWWFAEGSQKSASSASAPAFARVATWLLLGNANSVPARVTVRYILEGGGEIVRQYTVASSSRLTISPSVISELTNKSFGMAVTADVPITADRSMYFASDYREGHSSAGISALSTDWVHVEGTVGPDFDTYILLLNPTAAPATVTLTFRPDGGSPIVKTRVIPPNTRIDVSIEHEDPALASLSTLAVWTQVTSTVPIASERATYGPGPFETWRFAHASAGIGATATRWGLAEGVVGLAPKFATFYLIANPHPTATATVVIHILKNNGGVVQLPVSVPPLQRVTLDVGASIPALVDQSFAAVVESTNGVGIAVERSTFWTVPGGLAASSSPGVPLPPPPQ